MRRSGTILGMVFLAGIGCRMDPASKPHVLIPPPVTDPVDANPSPTITSSPAEARPASAIELESDLVTLASAHFEPTDQPTPHEPVFSKLPQPAFNLMETISLGLAQNPDLVALRQNENVGSAVLGVAETYPYNPFAQVRVTPYQDAPAAGVGTTYHYVLLMQRIELAHQQRFRENSAASALNQIRWSIHLAELQNVGLSTRLYLTALYQQELLYLAEESHQNNLVLKNTLEKQLDAGQASGADVAIARIDAQSTAQQLRLAQANYQLALRDLKRQVGLSPETELRLADRLTQHDWLLPTLIADGNEDPCQRTSPESISGWAASRPDVLAALADVDAARANLSLASAAKTPDVQVGPYYQRGRDEVTYLGLQAQMDLPVFNNGRPLERQRIAELNQRSTVWRQLFRRANLEGEAAWQRYQLAYKGLHASGLEEPIEVPNALAGLERQFQAGEVDITRVVQARNSILQNQRVRLDLYNELAQASADVIIAIGLPVEDIVR